MKAQQGDIISKKKCPCCGTVKPAKVNKNGNVYFDCREIVDVATRERCYYQERYGRMASKKLIQMAIEKGTLENVRI